MKTNFLPRCGTPQQEIDSNIAHTKTLGLNAPQDQLRPKLAVVGGGHSILNHIETLQKWEGDIWACGSAFPWCVKNSIDAIYFCIDGSPIVELARGAKKAILASTTHPSVFEVLKDAEVEVFDLFHTEETSNHGTTSFTSAPHLAISIGYKDVTFFGADSSFEGNSHAYGHYDKPLQMVVRVGEERFTTDPELFMQAELLATMIRLVPHVFKEESGGLLGAMVKDLDYDLISVSEALLALRVTDECPVPG